VVVVPLLAVVVPWLAVVVVLWFAVVVPPPALAPPVLPPLGCEAGADGWAAGADLGAGADPPLFFCPQARLGIVIRRLRTRSHLPTMLMPGRVDFILTLLLM
jgi:hypothetical protein